MRTCRKNSRNNNYKNLNITNNNKKEGTQVISDAVNKKFQKNESSSKESHRRGNQNQFNNDPL